MATDGTLEALASLPSFHHPTASPDGSEVAMYYDGSGRNELHVLDAADGEDARWSDGEVPRNARWYVRWGADGDRVFFHLDDGGDEQNDVYAVDRDGDVEAVAELDGQCTLQDVGDDGETLLVGSTADGQMNLYTHDFPSGETAKVTDFDRAASAGTLSPDCSRFAFASNDSDDFDNRDVFVADADGSGVRNLHVGERGAESMPVDWSPDGERLLVADNSTDLGRCGSYDVAADEVRWLGDDEAEEVPVAFLPDGNRVLALRTRRAAVMPVVYDLDDGGSRELDLPEGVAAFPQQGNPVLGDDRVLMTHTTPTERTELLAYDLATDEADVLKAADYGDVDPDSFADAEYFRFESHDGLEIGALLYDSGERPSPLIVNPHGGPRSADYRSFDLYTQFLVTRGYSVVQVNYRGSTGRGKEFVDLLKDDWGGDEQEDVAEAVRRVTERDWIDDDRVVVFGGSYGGYSAYWQTVRYPELYDAGVAWIGLTDLTDMFENTMPHFRTELMEKYLGTPAENPELYEERSPVSHVENLDAPLLMVHGVNDRRVPVSQARIFRDALDEAGYERGEDGDYEYVELGEEGHASSDIDQKIRLFRILDDFLRRRIGAPAVARADD